eukprot:TRINITY_DN24015_c0_g2_i1.p1 TRINITY_DN24015_c0_g2~~TRINITY_DN24015_c0_g2_i1.p1  ORF type:complete len:999 (-),score=123.97 TRINITY_DN24015_c0_g2_i1:251-3220(-)
MAEPAVSADEFRYPWAADIEAERAERTRRLEQVVEKSWQSAALRREEAINEQGLDWWLYFRLLRTLSLAFLLSGLLAVPKLAVVTQGGVLQQGDIFALLARASLGNVAADTRLRIGSLDLRLFDEPLLGILDALQLGVVLVALAWFWLWHLPAVFQQSDVWPVSAADYAVRVDALPPRLADAQANLKYDFELLQHFEAVARKARSGPSSALVCEVALVRDFGRALATALRRGTLEQELRALDVNEADGRRRAEELRRHVAKLQSEVASARREETDRAVIGAYVIMGTEEERDAILRAYRFSGCLSYAVLRWLPLSVRWLFQASRLRFESRYPLVVSAAPEPEDIVWQNVQDSSLWRTLMRIVTGFIVCFVLAVCTLLTILVWEFLLQDRISSAARCAAGDSPRLDSAWTCHSSSSREFSDETTLRDVCSCVCGDPMSWTADSSTCLELQATEATFAVFACFVISEVSRVSLSLFVPVLVRTWRLVSSCGSDHTIFMILAVAHSLLPFIASIALLLMKSLAPLRISSFGDGLASLKPTLVWEVDRGWYMHCAPVAALCVFVQWLVPPFAALSARCGVGRTLVVGREFKSYERYVSVVAPTVVAATLQPLLPWQAPLAAVGLMLKIRSERYLYIRRRSESLPEQVAPSVRHVLRPIRVAVIMCACAACAGAIVSIWVLGRKPHEFDSLVGEFFARAVASPVWPVSVVMLIVGSAVIAVAAVRIVLWFAGGTPPRFCSSQWRRSGSASSNVTRGGRPTSSSGADLDSRRTDRQKDNDIVTFQEAWLIMTHSGGLPTYQLHDRPGYRSALQELRPPASIPAQKVVPPSYSQARSVNNTSLASVGERAPCRNPQAKQDDAGPRYQPKVVLDAENAMPWSMDLAIGRPRGLERDRQPIHSSGVVVEEPCPEQTGIVSPATDETLRGASKRDTPVAPVIEHVLEGETQRVGAGARELPEESSDYERPAPLAVEQPIVNKLDPNRDSNAVEPSADMM